MESPPGYRAYALRPRIEALTRGRAGCSNQQRSSRTLRWIRLSNVRHDDPIDNHAALPCNARTRHGHFLQQQRNEIDAEAESTCCGTGRQDFTP